MPSMVDVWAREMRWATHRRKKDQDLDPCRMLSFSPVVTLDYPFCSWRLVTSYVLARFSVANFDNPDIINLSHRRRRSWTACPRQWDTWKKE